MPKKVAMRREVQKGVTKTATKRNPGAQESNVDYVTKGKETKVTDMSYKAPTEDDRCTSAFVTWSKPKIAHGHWMHPGERKEFAKMIADTLDGLETERRGPKREKAVRTECGVF